MQKKKSKLTPPKQYDGNTIEDIIKSGFDYCYGLFLKKDVKPLYKGKMIFFDMDNYAGMLNLGLPERFMHISSLEDKDEYHIYPCNNDLSYETCESRCQKNKALFNFSILNRIECLYRLSRIHWIPEIIQLAHIGDPDVYVWEEIDKDSKGNKRIYNHIRYMCGMDDYIIIFERRTKGKDDYKFITAFPVFTKNQKMQYDTTYAKATKK